MTMNASGQISLGGATVGQSINLEILQSATALVSLNTSAVRALAAVPTGAISMSAVYGKTYTRYATVVGTASLGPSSPSTITITISGGQPFAQFYIYLYNTTSGQPFPGYVGLNPPTNDPVGALDASGNWSNTFSIARTDPYWYQSFNVPGPYTNYFYVYQGATGQVFTLPAYPQGTLIGTVILSS